MTKVYVAGSSDELDRASYWKQRLIDAGFEVTSTWPEVIREAGTANPNVSYVERRQIGARCKNEVYMADVLWVLVPTVGPGRGAYFELGYANAEGMPIICSGPYTQSIFCAQGDEYSTDDAAFAALVNGCYS